MLQLILEDAFLPISIILILFGLYSIGWMVVHVSHARHTSWSRVVLSLLFGSILIGFGLHLLLVSFRI